MKNRFSFVAVFMALVGTIVLARYFTHVPNFTPVIAVGLFAAYYFRSVFAAISVPVAGMLLSDILFVGAYDMKVMLFVYGGLAIPALLGFWIAKPLPKKLQNSFFNQFKWKGGKLALSAIAGSTFFFFLSNLGVWLFSGMYGLSVKGLMACYVSAIPFYKFSLMGDLFYSFSIFGIAFALMARLKNDHDKGEPAVIRIRNK